MSLTVDELVSACFDEVQPSRRFKPYVQLAEEAGYPHLARLFRAQVASETVREALIRKGMVTHALEPGDYYVCPKCGLIFHAGCPDQCPVDETPGEKFIIIQ
jgi:rubrerythrin